MNDNMTDKERIKELTELLNKASKAYYTENREIMSNHEYDELYDELEALEKKTGIVLANSPTQNVGYEISKELVKEAHESPMLSLGKTKEPEELKTFLNGGLKGLLSWKLDGLTVVLTYNEGRLEKAVTRGNGEIGEVVTANAKTFVNLPLSIPYKGKLTVRGEAVIKYSDFERINEEIGDADSKYKNPRNLCSGAVRQLNPQITAQRSVNFFAFSLESTEVDLENSNENAFKWLASQGFDVVAYKVVWPETVVETVGEFEKEIENFDVPSDGLVLLMDDIAYGKSLGLTAKYPRNAIAFKWKDETAATTLTEIEWSPSRTGLINPVAIFDSVELEGTTVSRASLHNVSIIEGMKLGIGDEITVYKANMIIPQIAENRTKSGNFSVPDKCPACGADTEIKNDNGIKTLICPNAECPAKKIKSFADFVSRNAMNIDGISEETLEKFIGCGFIKHFSDLYKLDRFRENIINMSGFGEKSYENIIASVDKSRLTTPSRLLNGLGILNIGQANAKLICRHFKDDFEKIRNATKEELLEIDGVGEIIADTYVKYFENSENSAEIDRILEQITFEKKEETVESEKLKNMTFVITGSLNSYANREALKAEIEAMGGKVSGSVSKKTSYLINNDINSTSGKNKDAKKLGIPIITEDEYINRFR